VGKCETNKSFILQVYDVLFSGNDGRQGRLIKTLGNLQDLSRRIYRKRKTEVIGGCGVDAGEISGSKVPPIGYVP
jgi:hypothetical protein